MTPIASIAPRIVPDWLLPQERKTQEALPAEAFWETLRLFQAIDDLVRTHAEADWDGYGSPPLSPRAAETAKQLVAALPDGLPFPEPCPEPGGGIGLDWYVSPGMICSVSCAEDGSCTYAALMGEDAASGSFTFRRDEAFPDGLARYIREVSRHA